MGRLSKLDILETLQDSTEKQKLFGSYRTPRNQMRGPVIANGSQQTHVALSAGCAPLDQTTKGLAGQISKLGIFAPRRLPWGSRRFFWSCKTPLYQRAVQCQLVGVGRSLPHVQL